MRWIKRKIREWLRIPDNVCLVETIETAIENHTDDKHERLGDQIDDINDRLNKMGLFICGLEEYLGLEHHNYMEPDPQYRIPEPTMRPAIKFNKKAKNE